MKKLRKPCFDKKAWLTVFMSGMLSSGVLTAAEVTEPAVYSDIMTLRGIGDIPQDTTPPVPIPQTDCNGGDLVRVDITYAEQMLSDLTFQNIGTGPSNFTVLLRHYTIPGNASIGEMNVTVGTLAAVSPDVLGEYNQSWSAVPAGDTQADVSPVPPTPAVISQTITASPTDANDLADMGVVDPTDPTVGTGFPGGKTVTYTDAGDIAQFVGNGTVDVFMTSAAALDASTGGTFQNDVVTNSISRVEVVYTCDAPETTLDCAYTLDGDGDTVTAIVAGDESCHSLNVTEDITCDGDLGYDVAASPANCTITDNPAGTLTLDCDSNDTFGPNAQNNKRIVGAITGTDGSCSVQVTAMSCETPSGQTLTADTASCNDSYTRQVPTPPIVPPGNIPIPTLSEWGLMLLAGLLGLVGVQASRRRV